MPAPSSPPPRAGGGTLGKKIGPLPAWGWAGIVAGGILLGLMLRKRAAASSGGAGTQAPDPTSAVMSPSTGAADGGYNSGGYGQVDPNALSSITTGYQQYIDMLNQWAQDWQNTIYPHPGNGGGGNGNPGGGCKKNGDCGANMRCRNGNCVPKGGATPGCPPGIPPDLCPGNTSGGGVPTKPAAGNPIGNPNAKPWVGVGGPKNLIPFAGGVAH